MSFYLIHSLFILELHYNIKLVNFDIMHKNQTIVYLFVFSIVQIQIVYFAYYLLEVLVVYVELFPLVDVVAYLLVQLLQQFSQDWQFLFLVFEDEFIEGQLMQLNRMPDVVFLINMTLKLILLLFLYLQVPLRATPQTFNQIFHKLPKNTSFIFINSMTGALV